MSACKRYVLTKKLKKILETRGLILTCKLCQRPVQVGEEVETKQQARGRWKIYHSRCYDGSHMDI